MARFEGHAFQMPTDQSGHSRLIIYVSVKFQSTSRAFPTNPGMGLSRLACPCFSLKSKSLDMNVNMGRDPLKVDVSIFCYGFELIDYSNAHEVIHTSPVLQVLNGATAIYEDSNVARVSFVEDGL
ncbi:uncharacterized protein TNCV_4531371 [Trichonephila clavipes]|nr:uncharacterized protein TNCV_4531371 [Trichonephila clavipes]